VLCAGRARVEVDGERVHARVRERLRECLVVRMQAADVRQDDDAGCVLGGRAREGRGELDVAVERELLRLAQVPCPRRLRRPVGGLEAHQGGFRATMSAV
jgi:hypothetical protein